MAGDFSYESLKVLARERGQKVSDVLALSPNNDPFYTGSAGQVDGARWFADLYRQFYGGEAGIHLRRIHYRIVSQDPPVAMPSGELYQNTEGCWNYLTSVSKWARYLGMVDVDAFADKRNQEPVLHAYFYNFDCTPGSYVSDGSDFGGLEVPALPELPELPALPDLPSLQASGFDDIEQPYLIEIWVEKTTMNDVLDPICQRYRCNLVTGAGELSITAVRQFLQRARRAERPARILYISDFDPAGLGMPISIARKVEFYQRTDWRYEDLDIALQPIVLTEDQVRQFSLPRVPVKDSDLRKARFEAGHGEGQVELDALEALYPGTLATIVEREVLRYYDPQLRDRALSTKRSLQRELDRLTRRARGNWAGEMDDLRESYASVLSDYQALRDAFNEVVAQFQPQIDELNDRLAEVRSTGRDLYQSVQSDLYAEAAEVDLEAFALPKPELDGDPDGVLYESTRDYFDQIDAYAAQRDGSR